MPEPSSAGGASTTGTGRVGNLDVLRALAAYGVLVGHAYALGGRLLPVRADYWHDVPLIATATGVFLFFALSGYVISRPFVDRLVTGQPLPALVPYAIRRTFRIFPLYWIALTAVIVIGGATATSVWQYPVHYALLHNLVPGREGALFPVAWTLTLEILFYAALPLLALALARRPGPVPAERAARLLLISWVASILFTLGADLLEPGKISLWLRGSLPATWQMFCPGILLALAPHLRAPAWRRWVVDLPARPWAIPLAGAILAGAAVLYARAPIDAGIRVYQLVADACHPLFAVGYGLVVAAAIRSGPWFQRRGRWVLHMGLVSYGIYLLGFVVLWAFFKDFRELIPLPHEGLLAYVVHVAFLTVITIALAMASWRWLEQPCIRLGVALSRGAATSRRESRSRTGRAARSRRDRAGSSRS